MDRLSAVLVVGVVDVMALVSAIASEEADLQLESEMVAEAAVHWVVVLYEQEAAPIVHPAEQAVAWVADPIDSIAVEAVKTDQIDLADLADQPVGQADRMGSEQVVEADLACLAELEQHTVHMVVC